MLARSSSLSRLSALLFEGGDSAGCAQEVVGKKDIAEKASQFGRTISDGSTVASRTGCRRGQSDDTFDLLSNISTPQQTPSQSPVSGPVAAIEEVARLPWDLGEVSVTEQVLVPDGESDGEQDVYTEYDPEPTSLILVASDGTAYSVPDGDRVEWGELLAISKAGVVYEVPTPAQPVSPPAPNRPLKDGFASSFRPLEERCELEEVVEVCSRPAGSVPRNPSLKRLGKNLFAAERSWSTKQLSVTVEPELDMDRLGKVKLATPRYPSSVRERSRDRWTLQRMVATECVQQ